MAAGVVFAARERGIAVPDELSVIGFDDTPIAAHIWPPLDHGALADRLDGPRGGAQAGRRHDRRRAGEQPSMLPFAC